MENENSGNRETEKLSVSQRVGYYKNAARAALIIYHGINNPTEKQICFYILYGKPPRNP